MPNMPVSATFIGHDGVVWEFAETKEGRLLFMKIGKTELTFRPTRTGHYHLVNPEMEKVKRTSKERGGRRRNWRYFLAGGKK